MSYVIQKNKHIYVKKYNWNYNDLNYYILWNEIYNGIVPLITNIDGVTIKRNNENFIIEIKFQKKNFLKALIILEQIMSFSDGRSTIYFFEKILINEKEIPYEIWKEAGYENEFETSEEIDLNSEIILNYFEKFLINENEIKLIPDYQIKKMNVETMENFWKFWNFAKWYITDSNDFQEFYAIKAMNEQTELSLTEKNKLLMRIESKKMNDSWIKLFNKNKKQ